ncbi:NADH-ubiquinone oxidoreductase chain 4, partial [Gryllus bimaculatus]
NIWYYLLFLLMFWLGEFQNELYFSIIYLVFAVCEGSLGLGILISMVRSHGNDFFQSFMNILMNGSVYIFLIAFLFIVSINLSGNIEGLRYILGYDLLSYGSLIPTLFLILGWGYQPERVNGTLHLYGFWGDEVSNIYVYLCIIIAFLVKMPIFMAHVEAPISGSIVLAGVLFKLIGDFLIGLVSLRQVDLKSLIAYSSVVHIGIVLGGLMTLNS